MNAPSRIPASREEPYPVDPFARVLGLDRRNRIAFGLGLAVALGVHGTAGARAAHSLPHLAELARSVRVDLRERLGSEVDIDVAPPPPPPEPPPPEPEPEKDPAPPPPRAAQQTAPPPAAAEAGKVLTAEPDPDEPVDLTGEGFVTGTGDRFSGGVTAPSGKSKTAVRSAAAAPTGTGQATRAPVGPAVGAQDLSRAPSPISTDWSDCSFPSEADQEGVDYARVSIAVTVKPDGRARSVTVLKDPGFGFGAAARNCALRKVLTPGLNRAGQPIEQTTAPFTVTFTR